MIAHSYYEILGIEPRSGIDELKKAFRRLVRQYHPDPFPESQKQLQESKMRQINEAYARILEEYNRRTTKSEKTVSNFTYTNEEAAQYRSAFNKRIKTNPVGFHNDIQYAYYKQGFENYSRAVNGMKSIEKKTQLRNDAYYLKRFSNALFYLKKANGYYSKLLEDYPDSIWSYDAYIKIKRIDYFSRFYRKILQNIRKKIAESRKGLQVS
jgi:curved DNA-binding protein CbpA